MQGAIHLFFVFGLLTTFPLTNGFKMHADKCVANVKY